MVQRNAPCYGWSVDWVHDAHDWYEPQEGVAHCPGYGKPEETVPERPPQGPLIVVRIVWDHCQVTHEQVFGPWTVRDGWQHQEEIHEFLKAWQAEHGHAMAVTMYVVSPPESAEL